MEKNKGLSTQYAIPLIFILAVIPLVALVAVYRTDIGENAWISGTAFYDFFLYYKSQLLMLMGLMLMATLVMAVYRKCEMNWQGNRTYAILASLAVLVLFVLLSALFSEHRRDALFGGYEQFEGLFVWVAYAACFLLTYLFVTNEKWVRMLVRGLLIGSLVLSSIGALQTFGLDYMTNEAFLPILTMFLDNVSDGFRITASFGEGVAYATLYNPNYVGSYVALVLPVTVCAGVWEKNIVFRVIAVLSAICQGVMLVGAGSFAGIIGVIMAGVVAIVFLFADIRKNRIVLAVLAGIACLALIVGLVKRADLWQRFTATAISACDYTVSSIETKEDSFAVTFENGETLTGKNGQNGDIYNLSWTDASGEEVRTKGTLAEGLTMADKRFFGVSFLSMKREVWENETKLLYDVLRVKVSDTVYWDLLISEGKWCYLNGRDKLDTLRKVDSFGFEHQYDLATNRGYIWSRTLPLLKDTLFIGKGADNFVYAFPNDDYVGKTNCGFGAQTVTKPHNMYMQIWVQDGMFACLALVFLYLLMAIRTFRRCFKKGVLMQMQKLQIAIFCALTAYMTAGIANDSTICVAPIFWVLLGLGFAIDAWETRNS